MGKHSMELSHCHLANHRFAVGQMVRLTKPPLLARVQDFYEVLAQLPERDGEFQYRIKSREEPYVRMVREGHIEDANTGDALFGQHLSDPPTAA